MRIFADKLFLENTLVALLRTKKKTTSSLNMKYEITVFGEIDDVQRGID